jgi:hypothetical protein
MRTVLIKQSSAVGANKTRKGEKKEEAEEKNREKRRHDVEAMLRVARR